MYATTHCGNSLLVPSLGSNLLQCIVALLDYSPDGTTVSVVRFDAEHAPVTLREPACPLMSVLGERGDAWKASSFQRDGTVVIAVNGSWVQVPSRTGTWASSRDVRRETKDSSAPYLTTISQSLCQRQLASLLNASSSLSAPLTLPLLFESLACYLTTIALTC